MEPREQMTPEAIAEILLEPLAAAFGEAAARNDNLFGNGWGIQWHFPNGYGASIVCHEMTWNRPEGAVLKRRDDGEWGLCYDSGITGDVIPDMSFGEVYRFIEAVRDL